VVKKDDKMDERQQQIAALQKEINDKWNTLWPGEDDDDPYPAWIEYLDQRGLITSVSADCHWGEGGVTDAISDLIDLLNSDEPVIVVEDPSTEGSDHYGWLVFKR
jgi:hypothetical protein